MMLPVEPGDRIESSRSIPAGSTLSRGAASHDWPGYQRAGALHHAGRPKQSPKATKLVEASGGLDAHAQRQRQDGLAQHIVASQRCGPCGCPSALCRRGPRTGSLRGPDHVVATSTTTRPRQDIGGEPLRPSVPCRGSRWARSRSVRLWAPSGGATHRWSGLLRPALISAFSASLFGGEQGIPSQARLGGTRTRGTVGR